MELCDGADHPCYKYFMLLMLSEPIFMIERSSQTEALNATARYGPLLLGCSISLITGSIHSGPKNEQVNFDSYFLDHKQLHDSVEAILK